MDHPRDIHGTPIYVGDRVAIATFGTGTYDKWEGVANLIVRMVTGIDRVQGLICVPSLDGYDGCYPLEDTSETFLRLP